MKTEGPTETPRSGRSLGEKRLEFPAQRASGGWNSYAQPVVNSDRRRAFNGRGLAILRATQPGVLRLTTSADELRDASVSVQVVRGNAPEAIPRAR